MARLPSAVDLQRRPAPSETPGISVATPDHSPMARASAAMGQGVRDVAAAGISYLKSGEEIDDYETRKRLLDFRLQTEMDLENAKRDMVPGGNGFGAQWVSTYQKRARDFVGRDDVHIPQSQRAKVGLLLKQHEVALSERAQRYEFGERDRHHIDSLETQLGTLRDVVGASPDRRVELGEDGRKQIELSRIPADDKYRLRKKYDKEMDKAQATGRLSSVRTIEDFERFKGELRLDQEDGPDADYSKPLTSGIAKGKPAGWAATDPTWARLGPFQKAAAMALMEADGMDPQAARNALGAMINRASKVGEDLGAHVSQKIYQPTIEPAQQARLAKIMSSPVFAEMTAWAERRAQGAEPDPVAGATHFLASEKTMLALEAKEPQKYKSWRKWTGFNGSEYAGVITRDGSHAFLAPEGRHEGSAQVAADPSRSYAHLTIDERRAIFKQAEGEWRKRITETDAEIKLMRERAQNGDLPPDHEIAAVGAKVEAYGDPRLKQHLRATLSLAESMNRVFATTPERADAFAKQSRQAVADVQDGRYTVDQEKYLKSLDEAANTVRKNVGEDPMSWAHRRQLEVPTGDIVEPGAADEMGKPVTQAMRKVQLRQINFESPRIGADLEERFQSARDVARYYNQPPQMFTKNERKHLETLVANGGEPLARVLGTIVRYGGADGLSAIREFSKDAPEAYMIGKLMHEGGSPSLIDHATKEMKRRATEKDKYINKVDRKLSDPDVSDIMPVLARTPGLQDPVRHMTDAVYNYRHRAMGKDAFDAALYKSTMKEILGERKGQDGTPYGGVGTQNTGWFKDDKVLVPPQVRQDSFDAMIGALRTEDFAAIGTPLHSNGKALTIGEVHKATWRSIGDGRYGLQVGGDADAPRYAVGADGRPFVLDVKPVLERIKTRKPEIFER